MDERIVEDGWLRSRDRPANRDSGEQPPDEEEQAEADSDAEHGWAGTVWRVFLDRTPDDWRKLWSKDTG
jgi:hypothetical protein